MDLNYSVSNTVNFSSPGFTIEDPATSFPTIWGNVDFGFTLTFSTSTPNVVLTSISAYNKPDFVTITQLTPLSFRVEKIQDKIIFPGEYYKFALFDIDSNLSEVILDPDQANEETSIFKWNTPSQEIINSQYELNISYFDNGIPMQEILIYNQEFHWLLTNGLNILVDLVNESKY